MWHIVLISFRDARRWIFFVFEHDKAGFPPLLLVFMPSYINNLLAVASFLMDRYVGGINLLI